VPSVPFGDGGELIAVADALGIAHPPGYPWYTVVLKLAMLVPVGEPAARANAVSAVAGAAACALLALLVHRATRSVAASVAGALALAGASTFWATSTSTEVYAAHIAMMLALLALAQAVGLARESQPRRRALMLAGGVLGLGCSPPHDRLAIPSAAVWLPHRRLRRTSARREAPRQRLTNARDRLRACLPDADTLVLSVRLAHDSVIAYSPVPALRRGRHGRDHVTGALPAHGRP
jgi:hypothetical protein